MGVFIKLFWYYAIAIMCKKSIKRNYSFNSPDLKYAK